MPDTRIEFHRGQFVCCVTKTTVIHSLGHGMHNLTEVPRSTQFREWGWGQMWRERGHALRGRLWMGTNYRLRAALYSENSTLSEYRLSD